MHHSRWSCNKALALYLRAASADVTPHGHACRRVTDDVIRSLFVAQELLHTKVILLVHHTGASLLPSTVQVDASQAAGSSSRIV